MCNCSVDNKTRYALGDMNLLCSEGESSLITSEMWDKMAVKTAGTHRMKAPEVLNLYYHDVAT